MSPLNTGMRKSEQFCLEWSQVSLTRKRIRLEKTKNGSDREIPLNRTCFSVLEADEWRRSVSYRTIAGARCPVFIARSFSESAVSVSAPSAAASEKSSPKGEEVKEKQRKEAVM
jgi:hypothetical protein